MKNEKFKAEIDLHQVFHTDIKNTVYSLIEEALNREIYRVRIIHGKGKSERKFQVYGYLERHPRVLGYDDDGSNWGATIVDLKTPDEIES
jgi:DNA-nicking Smr family endonuclease